MRRLLTSVVLFCLLCGGGLMLLGSKFGAERTIEVTTDDGYTMEVSLFDRNGFFITGRSVDGMELPAVPTPPKPPRTPTVESAVGETVNGDLSGGNFTQVNVYAAIGEVTVQSGDSWSVSLDGLDSSYETYGDWLDVNASMGDVVVTVPRGITLDALTVDAEAGSVTLDGIQADYLDLDQEFGETVLTNCSWGYAEIENSCGSIKGTGLTSDGLEASADMGEIDLQGSLTGETDVESDMGSVTLTLSNKQSEYDLELEAGMGLVTLNGHGSGRGVSQSGGPHTLDVSCDMGSIVVQFAS